MTHKTHTLRHHPLPEDIRERLYGPAREQWRDHPHYLISNARALQRNHRNLKRQARQYHGALTHFLELGEADRKTETNRRLLTTIGNHGHNLLKNLHSHHGFEDSSVFPVLRQHHPRLAAGFDVLEQDHLVLDALLDDIDQQLNHFPALATDPRKLDIAHRQAADLEALLHRHMDDEEDIIVPIYLLYM
ncbi:hemerythrin domain-containing protein [Alcanivorax jadensis]|uniref:hemerythrin domain-containing protein n=1 Tax=Alcanivorax jadensis TaxID=64988 RepID=UPI00356259D5